MESIEPAIKYAVRNLVLETLSRETGHEGHHGDHGGSMQAASDGSMDHSSHGGMDMSDHLMSPFLFGDNRPFFVLFREAKVTGGGSLALALVLSCVFAILATMFSIYSKNVENRSLSSTDKRLSGKKVIAAALFAFRMFLHYIAMLLTMTMNIYVILAVVLGHGLGQLIYGIAFYGTKFSEDGSVEDRHDC